MQFPFRIKDSQVIAFEGLDATGKSTQMERMERGCSIDMEVPMLTPDPMFVHLPSGTTDLGHMVYDFTEQHKIKDPLARQYLHWASHREEYRTAIKPALKAGRSVFFDRCWWSAVAYCWFGNPRVQSLISREDFVTQAQLAMPVQPALVLLFLHPHADDPHNTEGVREGYEWLAKEYEDEVELIRPGNITQQNLQIFDAMASRGLYWNEAE
jgi:thymidylate kinase